MFMIAAEYPNEPTDVDKDNYKQFYVSILAVLPCKRCRESADVYSKQIPIDIYLTNKTHLIMWIYLLKTRVNEKLNRQYGKKKVSPPFFKIYSSYVRLIDEHTEHRKRNQELVKLNQRKKSKECAKNRLRPPTHSISSAIVKSI